MKATRIKKELRKLISRKTNLKKAIYENMNEIKKINEEIKNYKMLLEIENLKDVSQEEAIEMLKNLL